MNTLQSYLDIIVDPTFEEYKENGSSIRHTFLMAVAIYHAADRVAAPAKPGNVLQDWRARCPEFKWIEILALHFKHVKSDMEKTSINRGRIPVSRALRLGEVNDKMDFRNIYFLMKDAVKFLHSEVKAGSPL